MDIGIQIPSFSYGGKDKIGPVLNDVIKIVDNGGFKSLWVMDHYFQIKDLFGLSYDDEMLEGYSVLHYFAGKTKNVDLGTLVTGVIYRNPAFLIKQVTTLDVLSQGRAYLGIGAAWYRSIDLFSNTGSRSQSIAKARTSPVPFVGLNLGIT